ncbi:MAG: ATPase [Acidobacteriota bacterium]|nr:ATPase [Acidobacteriota bacterium]
MTNLFLGVDGGQSSTTALIADAAGSVLGSGTSGPCNHVSAGEGREKLARVLDACVGAACRDAGISDKTVFEAACFGMSGGAADKELVVREVIAANKFLVTDDAVIALAGALGGRPGVVTIAGTGSIALGRNAENRWARAGGWGHVFGDEGSAFDIVRQALRAALRAEEGWGPQTGLSDLFLSQTGLDSLNSVLHVFYEPSWPRPRVAGLAGEVDRCAREGDKLANEILKGAGQSLALLAQSARQNLWNDDSIVDYSYVGGVFRNGIVRERYRALLELDGCSVHAPLLGPAAGAVLEAYRIGAVFPEIDKLLSSDFKHV